MEITVNGESTVWPPADAATPEGSTGQDSSLAGFLAWRGNDPARVVVERNGGIVPAESFASTALCPGDVLEIVQFVGGG